MAEEAGEGRELAGWTTSENWMGLTASMATSAAADRSGWKRVVTNALAEYGT